VEKTGPTSGPRLSAVGERAKRANAGDAKTGLLGFGGEGEKGWAGLGLSFPGFLLLLFLFKPHSNYLNSNSNLNSNPMHSNK